MRSGPRHVATVPLAALIVLLLVALPGIARADDIRAGEYAISYTETSGCESGTLKGKFGFIIHLVDGLYILVPRADFPGNTVVEMTQDASGLSGTISDTPSTLIELSFKGRKVTGHIISEGQCGRYLSIKGAWKKKAPTAVRVLDQSNVIDEGAGLTWKVPAGIYHLGVLSSPDGAKIGWNAAPGCRGAKEERAFKTWCVLKTDAQLTVSNPTTLGLGSSIVVTTTLTQIK